jgi:hypothetical protein
MDTCSCCGKERNTEAERSKPWTHGIGDVHHCCECTIKFLREFREFIFLNGDQMKYYMGLNTISEVAGSLEAICEMQNRVKI